jgi:hypothetical protein
MSELHDMTRSPYPADRSAAQVIGHLGNPPAFPHFLWLPIGSRLWPDNPPTPCLESTAPSAILLA